MNILVVTEQFTFGGLETQLLGFVRHLQRLGHRVSFAVSVGGDSPRLRDCVGGRVLSVPLPPAMTGADGLAAAQTIADFCRREGCDFLHLHPFRSLAVGALAAALARLPFVLTLHGPGNLILDAGAGSGVWLAHAILPAAARVFCVCEELARMVAEIAPRARREVLLNGVDISRSLPARRDPAGPWAVISRLDSDKLSGVRFALEALLSNGQPDLRARVLGDGSCRAELAHWLAAQALGRRVTLEGHSDALDRDLRDGFAGVAGMTRVVLEAGAMGLPILLAGRDGVCGLVRRSEMDGLADANFSGRGRALATPQTLALDMEELARQPDKFDLRPWIRENANEPAVWKRYLALVRELEAPDPVRAGGLLGAVERHRGSPLFSEETASAILAAGQGGSR